MQVAVYCARKRENDWEYLLLRRIPSGGGYWQGITGGVEGDEEPLAAARRELTEETGFESDDLRLVDYSYSFPVEDSMRRLYEQPVETINEIVFLAVIKESREPLIDPTEHDAWEWCCFDMAIEKLHWPGNRESLRHSAKLLRELACGG